MSRAEVFTATGACLCGAVRFGLKGDLPPLSMCHCSLCRRVSGGASNAILNIGRDSFVWLAGEDRIQQYATPRGWKTRFCRACGCPVPHVRADGRQVLVPAGALDGDPQLVVSQHIFVGSKAHWDAVAGDAPQFDEWPT